jgi:hypothetical protein
MGKETLRQRETERQRQREREGETRGRETEETEETDREIDREREWADVTVFFERSIGGLGPICSMSPSAHLLSGAGAST